MLHRLRILCHTPGAFNGPGMQPGTRAECYLRVQAPRDRVRLHRDGSQIHWPELSRSREYPDHSSHFLLHLQRAWSRGNRLVHLFTLEHQEQEAEVHAGQDESDQWEQLSERKADIQSKFERTMTIFRRGCWSQRYLVSSLFLVNNDGRWNVLMTEFLYGTGTFFFDNGFLSFFFLNVKDY